MPITLKAARTNARLNQTDAAKRLGISPQTLSSWELGRTFPDALQILKLQELYSVSYDDLIFLPSYNALSVEEKKPETKQEEKS